MRKENRFKGLKYFEKIKICVRVFILKKRF